MSGNTRRDRAIKILRAFQVYYLAFVCFLAAYGELFPGQRFGMGRKIENLLVIPIIVVIALVVLERRLKLHIIRQGNKLSASFAWHSKRRLTWREYLLAAFIVFVGLGLFYSPHPDVVRKGLMQVITASILYFLLLHAVRSKFDFKIFASAFIAGGVLTTLVGIVHYFSNGQAGTPTWGNPNIFGAFLQIPVALTLCVIVFHIKRWRVLAVVVPVFLFLLLGVYLSQSRGAWLGCAVIVIVVGLLGGKRGLLVTSLIVVLGILVLLIFPTERVKRLGLSKLFSTTDNSLSGRYSKVWPASGRIIGERPLIGYGLNTYNKVYEDQQGIEKPDYSKIQDSKKRARAQIMYIAYTLNGNVHPHNELMQAWTSMGIAGVFFYAALFVTVLLTYLDMRRLKLQGFIGAMGLGVFAWYMGHTAHGIFDCFFFFRHAFASAAIMFALMFGVYYLEKHKDLEDDINNTNQDCTVSPAEIQNQVLSKQPPV